MEPLSPPGRTGPGGGCRMPAVNGVGEPCAGEPHARFEVAGAGNGATWPWPRQRSGPQAKAGEKWLPDLTPGNATAPAPDPTFGVGAMDKAGSGLANVAHWCADNAGSATFGPRRGNSVFVAVLHARPERPDPVTGTAEPAAGTQSFLTNICPLLTGNASVHVTTTDARRPRDLLERADVPLPPFAFNDGRVLTFADPASEPGWAVLAEGGTERFSIDDLIADPAEEALVIELIHRTLIRHAEDRGMIALPRHRRLYFPRAETAVEDPEDAAQEHGPGSVPQSP